MTTGGEADAGAAVPHWRVAIIGAGAGGLGLGIRLAKARQRDFVIFEASDGVGGTWRANTYPGAACDVPSHLYSYSFALKPDWTKTYAQQPEILEYFEHCADRFGIRPHLRTRTRITAAHWDEAARRWHLTDADGGAYDADVLVSAIGTFTTPSYPDIDGLATFAGPCFHSARWEHQHDLAGRRVAVIGTGAERGADRAGGGQGRRRRRRLPAHAAVDPAPLRQALHRGGEAPLRPQPGRHTTAPARDLLGLREHDRLPPRGRDGRAAQGDCAQPHPLPD